MSSVLISDELLLTWFAEVDKRHGQVAGFMRQQLVDWSARAELPKLEIRESPGLDALHDIIYTAVTAGKVPMLQELTDCIAAQDAIWQLLFEVDRPKTLQDLAYASYTAEELRHSLRSGGGPAPMLIAVEDHYEHKIYEAARKFLRRIRKLHPDFDAIMLGFYPLESFFLTNTNRNDLYLNDVGDSFTDETGAVYSAEALLEHVYGATLPAYDTNPEPA